MGVPAFYRWLSEKYPKIVIDVLEERVQLAHGSVSVKAPFDSTRPNPNGIECDNLYIDMNGIIHPCSHPEIGPQPETEEEMYSNVCEYVDRLFRIHRPRKLLYLAIDGVAPRAKMNQQRSRRFRSAQEARELAELEKRIKQEVYTNDDDDPNAAKKKEPTGAWDSNVITPGTPFMLKLAEFVRFYIRKRISTEKAWKTIKVIFSDASLPGEGEHKIMTHIRLQRAQSSGYNPNTVHVLHGLDADLIMLALATHEVHFYISREEVTFGRKSEEMKEQRQIASGFRDQQNAFNEEAGDYAMQLIENQHKPLQLISIPILREYLAIEFASLLNPNPNNNNNNNIVIIPFTVNLERLIDDFVFMCFFVGNDFLPHLPSLDIRDGALDYLLNVYQRILPTFGHGEYITKSGGNVNLTNVDILLAEVGQIEDYVFQMKYNNEQQEKKRREDMQQRNKRNNNKNGPPSVIAAPTHKVLGRAARILEKQQQQQQQPNENRTDPADHHQRDNTTTNSNNNAVVALHSTRKEKHFKHTISGGTIIQVSHMKKEDNTAAADALKLALSGGAGFGNIKKDERDSNTNNPDGIIKMELDTNDSPGDREKKVSNDDEVMKQEEEEEEEEEEKNGNRTKRRRTKIEEDNDGVVPPKENGVGEVGDANDEFDADEEEEDIDDDAPNIDEIVKVVDPKVALLVKEKVKAAQQKQLEEYAKNVVDNVRLHEEGWKDRYYSDKCKADDVKNHGGREHMFRSYVMGLCWVMKYYYDGVPSWKWYYPFHYSPFASDLKNIERFEKDCRSFEVSRPFNPVEQLMAVLPADSAHAIPKASRWLLSDPESPIIDFYPVDVPVDPNGKAMPWLWVVLLPFIDEDRLLAALSPTMTKWTTTELLGNARGLDDGYLYVHRNEHALSSKLSTALVQARDSKAAAASKTRLTDVVQYGISGSVRAPLSNETYPPDQDVVYPLPPTAASKINTENGYSDNVFSEPLDPNDAICVAFTEPPKLSHKSNLLPGVKIPQAKLVSPEDRLIRRPRLNRFGGTIANLGGAGGGFRQQGQSYQSGYGSMHISQYERDVARQTGRGHEMHQAGTRTWGSMEPTPKRFHGAPPPPPPPPPPHQGSTFMNNSRQRGPEQGRGPQQWQPNPNHQQPPRPYQHGAPHQHYGVQQQHQQQHPQQYGAQQQQHFQRLPPQQQYRPPPPPPQYPQQAQYVGHNFRQGYGQPQPQQQHPQAPPRASSDVMNSLRAQLTSTLNQNRNNSNSAGRGHQDNNRRRY